MEIGDGTAQGGKRSLHVQRFYYFDDGTELSASSVAAVTNNLMLIGSVFSNRIVVCDLSDSKDSSHLPLLGNKRSLVGMIAHGARLVNLRWAAGHGSCPRLTDHNSSLPPFFGRLCRDDVALLWTALRLLRLYRSHCWAG